jgi:hypothetical protein
MNLKEKLYLYANYSTTQRCPKEKMKIFKIEDFFHLPPLSKKIRNGLDGKIRGLRETDPCRKPEVKNLVALSL